MTYDALPFSGIATFFKAPLWPRRRRPTPTWPSSASAGTKAPPAAPAPAWGLARCARPPPCTRSSATPSPSGTAKPAWNCSAASAGLTAATWRSARCGRPSATTTPSSTGCEPHHGIRPLPRHARRRPLDRLPGAQGALPVPRGQARAPGAVRHPHGLLGRGGRLALLARQPHHPQPRGGLPREPHAVRHPQPAHPRRQHRPGQEPRGAHLLVPAGQGHARGRTSSSTCPRAPTCTSPSTSTRSTRRSRRAPARPSRAASATTRPRTSCSAVCDRCNVVGMDLVEVAPQYDGPGQVTALHGARLILDTVGAVFRSRAALK